MEKELIILVWLDEHQAMLCETMSGWNVVDCAEDNYFKQIYLHQNFTIEDFQAWNKGLLTEHCLELLNDTGLVEKVEDVIIKYCNHNRQYEIEIVERIAI